ncbi:MAG: putative metal-dependent phosphoesterase TrpH [Lentisphaeria bacterium]
MRYFLPPVPIYDLHCHSDQSDGILSPEELVSRAKLHNVSVLALTDHDTVAGLARAKQQAQLIDLELICGIEFSSQWQNRGIHVVGLNVDVNSEALRSAVQAQEALRCHRGQVISEKLAALGIPGALAGALKHASSGVVGRPHFAAYLVETGVCRSVQQAFKRYLGTGKPGDVKQLWPEIEEVVSWVRAAGGVAVLAHPDKYKMTRTKLCTLVDEFKASGGQGLEVVSGFQSDVTTQDLAKTAIKYSLHASCGSDFHAPGGSWQELGRFPALPAGLTPVWSLWE